MAELELAGIRKAFGTTRVLDDVSLTISDGEFVTLVGPSGCGKSTLLKVIAGLEHADGGSVRIGSRPVDHVAPKGRDVAMVFQSYALYPHMTVAENLAVPLRMRRLSRWGRLPLAGRLAPRVGAIRAGIDQDVRRVAESLEIAALLPRRPAQLSGGQRQRVALGRAMVRDPKVFLMDEPLSNLDAKLRVQMRAEIAQLHRRLATTFVYVTHDQAEALTMSDRIAVMMGGRLLQVGPPAAVYADPADVRVAEFIGSPKINLLPARALGDGQVECLGASLALGIAASPGTPLQVAIRPEHLSARPSAHAAGWRGSVRHREHFGADLYLHVMIPGATVPVVVRTSPDHSARFELGGAAALLADPSRILVFDAEGARVRPTAARPPEPVAVRALERAVG